MSHSIHTHLDHITDTVSRNHDGLRTLAALLAHAGDRSGTLQRQDELVLGLSALIGAIADQCQETIEALCVTDKEVAAMTQHVANLEAEQRHRESMPLSTREGMAAHAAIVFGPHLSAGNPDPGATAPQ